MSTADIDTTDGPEAAVLEDRDPALEQYRRHLARESASSDDGAPKQEAYEFPGDRPPSDDTINEPSQTGIEAEREPPSPPDENDVEDIIEPKTLPIARTLWALNDKGKRNDITYTQKELSYFGKIEMYGLFGRAIDTAMQGPNALGIDDLIASTQPKTLLEAITAELPGATTSPEHAEQEEEKLKQIGIEQAGKVLATFARILSFSPDLLKEAYCIALNIPKGHRNWAINLGGLESIDDDTGDDILQTFIDQNYPAMHEFFTVRLPKSLKRMQAARKRFDSAPSKR